MSILKNFQIKSEFLKYTFFIILAAFTAAGCGSLKEALQPESPRDKYESSLQKAGLSESVMGREWKAAGERALRDTFAVKIPFKESGYFFADRANVLSYSFNVKKGELLNIRFDRDTVHKMNVFMDLFRAEGYGDKRNLRRLTSAKEGELFINEEINQNGLYLLRIQPELMSRGRYVLTITITPQLAFPVKGKSGKAIGSFFGDGRDGGSRRHEGVDIFAAKRTPVLAVSDGMVTRTPTGGLGGKTVWMAGKHGWNYYYAHLDSQVAQPGQIVREGDVLGLVGNTGNASKTSFHLHFGIYVPGEGAVDPFPFINDTGKEPPEILIDPEVIGAWGRIRSKNVFLRPSPETKSASIIRLSEDTPVEITGGAASFLKVRLPDNTTGYVDAKGVEKAETLRLTARLNRLRPVFDAPANSGVIMAYAPENSRLEILGEYNGFYFVRNSSLLGWISKN